MINFFRRIRQALVKRGELKKYAIYAIGKVLLVVLGILIAIGLNNWWQERQNFIEAKPFC